ncbi:MAG: hypothetical protein ABIP51_22910 [Bacteroidia bacterium]
MIFRILKYLLNSVALVYLCLIIFLLITFSLDCEPCKNIKGSIGYAILYSVIYLAASTLFNFLVERFLEKRKISREFLLIFCISFIIISLAILISSHLGYKDCCEIGIAKFL